jgi:hypothetical protein
MTRQCAAGRLQPTHVARPSPHQGVPRTAKWPSAGIVIRVNYRRPCQSKRACRLEHSWRFDTMEPAQLILIMLAPFALAVRLYYMFPRRRGKD